METRRNSLRSHLLETYLYKIYTIINKSKSINFFLIILLIACIIPNSSGLSSNHSSVNANIHYTNTLSTIEQTYPLDSKARDKLNTNGFVVLDEYEYGNISKCYSKWCFNPEVSVFITSDAMLHIFHVVHDNMLKDIEKQHLYNSTELLVNDLQKKSMWEYNNSSSDLVYVKEAARRNVVFFTVAGSLLNDTYPIPGYVQDNVMEYVQKVDMDGNNDVNVLDARMIMQSMEINHISS